MQNEIKQTLKSYKIGKLINFQLLTNGFSNENYRIETEKGLFLYRICKQQSIAEIQTELRFLQMLKNEAFPAAFPIQKSDSSFISEQNNYPVVIYHFIKGEIPKLTVETVKEIAKANAKLNVLKFPVAFLPKNSINMQAARKLINQFPNANYQYPEIFNDFSQAINYLKDKIPDNLPKGIIHADIFPDNTIFKGNKLKAIIDFENICFDDLLFDLAMSINGFCFVANQLDLTLMKTFLENYQKIRPLSDMEKNYLPEYILWTAVGMASWHLQHNVLKVKNDQQTMRVKELLDRYKMLKSLEEVVLLPL